MNLFGKAGENLERTQGVGPETEFFCVQLLEDGYTLSEEAFTVLGIPLCSTYLNSDVL
jgi:hypothetical protein